MADKVPTLEDLARAEEAESKKRDDLRAAWREGQALLRTAVPARFFTLARQVREGVARFNGAARLERSLAYTESVGVTTRDPNLEADFFVEVRRDPNWCLLAMRTMWRLHLPDALIIEGEGRVGVEPNPERLRLRIEGVVREGQVAWRITSDGKPVDTPIDEIADRLVAVVATGELTRLWTMAPFI